MSLLSLIVYPFVYLYFNYLINMVVVQNVVFYSSLAYNIVLNKLAIRTWYDRIDRAVILGALPFRGKFANMELIKRENVTAVISMNEDHELKMFVPDTAEWARLGVEFLQLPTRDYVEVPSLENLKQGVSLIERHVNFGESIIPKDAPLRSQVVNDFDFSSEHLSSPSNSASSELPRSPTVYVHCKAGRTRSATLVACYLVKRYGFDVEEAVAFIRTKRPHIYLTNKHLNAIRNFQKSL